MTCYKVLLYPTRKWNEVSRQMVFFEIEELEASRYDTYVYTTQDGKPIHYPVVGKDYKVFDNKDTTIKFLKGYLYSIYDSVLASYQTLEGWLGESL
jgi:hypothetical protein